MEVRYEPSIASLLTNFGLESRLYFVGVLRDAWGCLTVAVFRLRVFVGVLVLHALRVRPALRQAQLEVVSYGRKQHVVLLRRLAEHVFQHVFLVGM